MTDYLALANTVRRVADTQGLDCAAKVIEGAVQNTISDKFLNYEAWCFDGMGRVQLLRWIQEKVFEIKETSHE